VEKNISDKSLKLEIYKFGS